MKIATSVLLLSRLPLLAHSSVVQESGQVGLGEVEITEDGNGIMRDLSQISGSTPVTSKTTRVVVRYSNDQGRIDAMALGGEVYHDFVDEKLVALELDDTAIAQLDVHDGNIVSVEADHVWEEQGYLVEHLDESNVRRLAETTPYGIRFVQADQITMGSTPVAVCIADTGGAKKHPDLRNAPMSGSNRYASGVTLKWSKDTRGHGTHVAGTISAVQNNGIGVRGIGNIPIHMTRALDNEGRASETDVMEAVKQCAESGARIISMSLGGGGMSTSFKEYMNDLYYDRGLLIFGASGNDGQNVEKWPGSLPVVVSVSAIDEAEVCWSGSNYGSWVEMAAPGSKVLSTSVNSLGEFVYSYFSGTSMAVPHASGVAALLWSHHPTCKNYQIRYAMAVTAKDLDDNTAESKVGCDPRFGHGLVQAKSALEYLNSHPCSGNWGSSASQGGCYA